MILNFFQKKFNLNPNLQLSIFLKYFLITNLKKKLCFFYKKRDYFYNFNEKFYVNTDDKKGTDLSKFNSLQVSKIKFLTERINKTNQNSTFIDIGANYGEFSSIIKIKNIQETYIFEPNKDVSRYLKKNLELNSYKNYHLIESAISLSKQKLITFYLGKSSGSSSLISNKSYIKKIQVSNIWIINFLNLLIKTPNKVFFFKIDIEGVDFEITKAIVNFFSTKKIYKYHILFEYSSNDLFEIITFLSSSKDLKALYCVYPKIEKLNNKNLEFKLKKLNIYKNNYSYDLYVSNDLIDE